MTGKPNSSVYRNSSIENKMEVQFKKIVIQDVKDEIKIIGLYIIDENRYFYHIFNKMEEQFYMISKNKCFFVKVIKRTFDNDTDICEYICDIGKCGYLEFQISFEEDDSSCMDFNDKTLYNKLDSYMWDMFFDIYRMNNS